MARLNNIYVTMEIEPIVKVRCMETNCEHNLVDGPGGYFACELKHLDIEKGGVCSRMILRTRFEQTTGNDRLGDAGTE